MEVPARSVEQRVFGLGTTELLVILAVAAVVLGQNQSKPPQTHSPDFWGPDRGVNCRYAGNRGSFGSEGSDVGTVLNSAQHFDTKWAVLLLEQLLLKTTSQLSFSQLMESACSAKAVLARSRVAFSDSESGTKINK
eukprot:43676-Amphidinium_carterae.1